MADLTEAVAAVLGHEWGEGRPLTAHDNHTLHWLCDVCHPDVLAMLQVAAPIIERQVRAEVAEGIAQLLDDLSEACGEDEEHFKVAYSTAAQVARIKGAQTHTQPAETPGQDS